MLVCEPTVLPPKPAGVGPERLIVPKKPGTVWYATDAARRIAALPLCTRIQKQDSSRVCVTKLASLYRSGETDDRVTGPADADVDADGADDVDGLILTELDNLFDEEPFAAGQRAARRQKEL